MIIISSNIPDDTKSSVYVGYSTIEIITVKHPQNNLSCYRRMTKNLYVDASTGELKEYNIDSRVFDKTAWLRKSMTKLRRLIDCNFVADDSELFLTLTFHERVTYQEARDAFRQFWNKLRYHHFDSPYVTVIEPTNNGNWHLHVLMKCVSTNLEHDKLSTLWNHGYVCVKRVPFENFGRYFSKREKLMRAEFYPPHVKLFTASRELVRPVADVMTHGEALSLVQNKPLMFEVETPVYTGDKYVNTILYQNYRRI